jgi:hypothetical protein
VNGEPGCEEMSGIATLCQWEESAVCGGGRQYGVAVAGLVYVDESSRIYNGIR